MKLLIAGNAVVVQSAIKIAELKAAAMYAPTATTVYDEDNNQVFRVSQAEVASVSPYGVAFDGENDGFATATLLLGSTDDKIKTAKEKFGVALATLAEHEELIRENINAVAGAVENVFASATIAGQTEEEA